ncbi:MAG: DUF4352 domain-containing protein [Acidimicrobiia bacterium]|nr:DUF4352 domain-containing protein [Acidimicrobiia bacterium]
MHADWLPMPRLRLITVFLALVLVVSGCSGNADKKDSPGTGATATSEPTSTPSSDPETTTTLPEPEATTTSVTVTGTMQEPIPVGEVVQVGDWRIRVSGVTADGTEMVLARNQFNDPPSEGRQFFVVHLEATYTGSESADFWIDVSLKVVGPSNVAYESFGDSCGVIPDAIDDSGEVFPGGSIAGNVCWSVTEQDAQGLVLLAEESFSLSDTRAYLSLDPAATPVQRSTAEGVEGSSRLADAIPIGKPAEVGPWILTVVDVTPDATDLVVEGNQFNEAPGEGEQFYLATVTATYDGDESSTFWIDMTLKAVGDSSVAYEGGDGSCGVIADSLFDAGETFPGGTITGNVCWKVRSDDVGSLVMIARESFSLSDDRVYLSLTPG